MSERDRIYLEILGWGLCRIRDAASQGWSAYCAVEAEHLHNLPSLVQEANEHRHSYYFDSERTFYLERVDRTLPGVDMTLRRYASLWRELEQLRGSGE
jgi:hypothetical protein